MRLRFDVPAHWRPRSEISWEILAADRNRVLSGAPLPLPEQAPAEAQIFYWSMTGGTDAASWIEQVASSDLPAGQELFGTSFSESSTELGWPVTRIEASVREQGSTIACAARLVFCIQIFDAFFALRLCVAGPTVPQSLRSEVGQVVAQAYPSQSAEDLVGLADLWR